MEIKIVEDSESKEFQILFNRFWSKVDIKSKNECWNWLASTNGGRYGKFKYRGKFHSAHRFAYEFTNGPIKDGLQVLHKCDNEKCVNPDHLYLGTQSDNMKDRSNRNPVPPELSASGKAKLYEDEIWLVRRLKDKFSSRFVAGIFKVSQRTICRIWRSKMHMCREGYYA